MDTQMKANRPEVPALLSRKVDPEDLLGRLDALAARYASMIYGEAAAEIRLLKGLLAARAKRQARKRA